MSVIEGTPIGEAATPATGLTGLRERTPSRAVKLAYGVGEICQSTHYNANGFVFFFYTAVLGLPGSLVGLALFFGLFFDAAVDPVLGSVSDNLRTRFGKRLPLMLVGGPLMALCFALVFAPPPELAMPLLFGWLALTSVATRVFLSVYYVPYVALGAELATGYVERSSVVAYRTVFGILTGVIVTALAYSVFFSGERGGLQAAANYGPFGWAMFVLATLPAVACCIWLRRYAASLPNEVQVGTALHRRFMGELREVFRNHSFRVVFFASVLFWTAQGLHGTLNAHAYVFVWKLSSAQIQTITYAFLAGFLLGVPLTPLLLRRVEKRTAVLLGLTVLVVSQLVLGSLWAAGLFRPEGAQAAAVLSANVFLAGIGVAFAAIALPSMMADAADEHEEQFGRRREGMYFAGLGFSTKAATGVGTLAAGLALDLLRFPANTAAAETAAVPADALQRLVLAWGPFAAVVTFGCVLTLAAYRITRARHAEIAAELRRRSGGEPAPAE